MMRIKVSKPALFRRDGPVFIETPDRIPFYVKDTGGDLFTLPVGRYTVKEGAAAFVAYLDRPVPSDPIIHRVPRIRVKLSHKHGKAAIDTRTGQVFIHPAFSFQPEFVRRFILLHELGHLRHDDEEGADGWAARCMYAEGFNPSQIDAAARLSLSVGSCGRIGKVSNFAKQVDGQG